MERIRSLIFYIFLAIWTVMVFAIGGVLFVLRMKGAMIKVGQYWGKVGAKMLSLICSVKVNISGVENIPQGSCIVASKHQSVWETIFLLGYIDNAKFVIKKQLSWIPFYGQYTQMMGMISVDRSRAMSALKDMIRKCASALKSGGRVVIFPEGTRANVGEKIELKSGIFAIYKGAPDSIIVPVYLDAGEIWPSKSLLIKSGEINIVFKKGLQGKFSKDEFLHKIHKSINSPSID